MRAREIGRAFRGKWFTILAAVLIVACGGGLTTLLKAADITAHLTIVYSTGATVDSSGNWPACSSSVKTLCITGFNIYDLTGGQRKLLFTLPNATTTSGQQTVTGTQTVAGFTYGTHSLVATVALIDVSGTAGEGPDSAPAQCVYAPGTTPSVVFDSATAK